MILRVSEPRRPARAEVVGRLAFTNCEAARLHAITDRPFKVTLPAASWFLPTVFFESEGPYASHDELLEDTLAIQRELIAEAIDLDRRVIEGFPGEVTFGMHTCRGNQWAKLADVAEAADAVWGRPGG
jgi:methionine synthase II (cobalamin-independent)